MSDALAAVKEGLVVYDFLTYKAEAAKRLSPNTAKKAKDIGMVPDAIDGGISRQEEATVNILGRARLLDPLNLGSDSDLTALSSKIDEGVLVPETGEGFSPASRRKVKEYLTMIDFLTYKVHSLKMMAPESMSGTVSLGITPEAVRAGGGLTPQLTEVVKALGAVHLTDRHSDTDLKALLWNEDLLREKICAQTGQECSAPPAAKLTPVPTPLPALVPASAPPPSPSGALITWTPTLVQEMDGDDKNWEKSSWSNNGPFLNTWQRNNISFKDGLMTIALDNNGCPGACDGKPVASGEYRTSKESYGYGYYEARMKPAAGSGLMAGSLFTYRGTYGQSSHDEIDLEFLGKDQECRTLQTNYYAAGRGHHEQIIDLDFNACQEFHNYGFKWTKDTLTFYVDGKVVRDIEGEKLPTRKSKIMANLWAGTSEVNGWLGSYKNRPAKAQYDWIKYSALEAAKPAPESRTERPVPTLMPAPALAPTAILPVEPPTEAAPPAANYPVLPAETDQVARAINSEFQGRLNNILKDNKFNKGLDGELRQGKLTIVVKASIAKDGSTVTFVGRLNGSSDLADIIAKLGRVTKRYALPTGAAAKINDLTDDIKAEALSSPLVFTAKTY